MAAMIGLVCAAHLEPGSDGPLVTTVEKVWAYCLGGAQVDHDWRPVAATPIEDLQVGIRHRLQDLLGQAQTTRPLA